jgi:hypothetical protein
VFFLYVMRRVDCAGCGVTVEQVPWAEGNDLRIALLLRRLSSSQLIASAASAARDAVAAHRLGSPDTPSSPPASSPPPEATEDDRVLFGVENYFASLNGVIH